MTSGNPTEQDHPAPNADDKADHNAAETNPEVSPTIGATEPETKPSSQSCNQSGDKQKHWLDYLGAGMAGIGLLVLIAYTIFTGLMYCANKKAAEAAKSAADTAFSTLQDSRRFSILQQRPYLVPKSGSTAAFVHIPVKGVARASATLWNVGHTPAQSAEGFARMRYVKFPANQQSYNPFNEIDRIFADLRVSANKGGGIVPRQDVAPEASYFFSNELPIPLSDDDVKNLQRPYINKGFIVFLGFTRHTDPFGENSTRNFAGCGLVQIQLFGTTAQPTT